MESLGLFSKLKDWLGRQLKIEGEDQENVTLKVNLWLNIFFGCLPIIGVSALLFYLNMHHYALGMLFFVIGALIIVGVYTWVLKDREIIGFVSQIYCVLISFAAVIYFGGILYSGGVVLVGLMGSLMGLTFTDLRKVKFVFGLYFLTILIEVILQPWLQPIPEFSQTANLLLFAGHIITVIIAIFSLIHNYIQQNNLAKIAEADRLRQLDLAKTKLYNNITHEFRTPLTAILGSVDLIREQPVTDKVSHLNTIKRNADDLLRLVNQMLGLSKVESGNMPVRMSQLDILPFLRYLLEGFHSLAEFRKIDLSFHSELSEFVMDYDPDQIELIISNLISNAIQFTDTGGKVKLIVELDNEYQSSLILKIIDTGIGIPKTQIEKVFDRFYQVDGSVGKSYRGTGIGLALVNEVVKLLNGDISVFSREGEGSEFRVRLPVTRIASHSVAEGISPGKDAFIDTEKTESVSIMLPSGSYEKPSLLIVEDHQDVVNYLIAILQENYHLIIRENGIEGMKAAIENIPDLILSDVMMPGMDGFEMCDKLKNDLRTSHIPIILLTARSDQASKIEGLTQGADVYLTKPFHREELNIQLQNLIELRKKLHRYYKDHIKQSKIYLEFNESPYPREDKFLNQVSNTILEHMDDDGFGIKQICIKMGLSRSQLYRKFTAVTGQSIGQYLRTLRLNKAEELLLNTDLNISQIAFEVGYKHQSHFTRAFIQQFGKAPSEMRKLAH